MEASLMRERLSYSMSLLYALQTIPGRRLGRGTCPLEALTSLEVHVVSSIPLFDSETWEVFMHRLPNLKQLSLVFIMQGRDFKHAFNIVKNMSIGRCGNCEDKKRVVKYSSHHQNILNLMLWWYLAMIMRCQQMGRMGSTVLYPTET